MADPIGQDDRRTGRCGLARAMRLIAALAGVGGLSQSRAQDVGAPPPATVAAPGRPAAVDLSGFEGAFEAPSAYPRPGPSDPSAPPARVDYGPLDVIRESIFGPASKENWKPMTLDTFFTEGWDEPFVNAPEGTNGAPKQNWIGAPAGVFGRFATLDGFYTNHLNNVPGLFLTPNAPFMPVHPFTNGNQYTGYGTILVPLNARMELLFGTAFITSNKSSPAGGYTGNWGDTGIQAPVPPDRAEEFQPGGPGR